MGFCAAWNFHLESLDFKKKLFAQKTTDSLVKQKNSTLGSLYLYTLAEQEKIT